MTKAWIGLLALAGLAWFSLIKCRHSHRSKVFSIDKETYFCCWQCGQKIPYDWKTMRAIQ